jgi:hypothetical protein
LQIFASRARRTQEMQEMKHIDASFDYRGPFKLPGTGIFRDFCASCTKRYCLDGVVLKAKVRSLGCRLRLNLPRHCSWDRAAA